MQLEEMIHAFWRDTATLHSAMPLERFFTGPTPIPSIPCVLMVNEKSELLLHTSRGTPWTKISLRFEVHHDDFQRGSEQARLIEQTFDRLRLGETEGERSFHFRFAKSENLRNDDATWKFVRTFRLIG